MRIIRGQKWQDSDGEIITIISESGDNATYEQGGDTFTYEQGGDTFTENADDFYWYLETYCELIEDVD